MHGSNNISPLGKFNFTSLQISVVFFQAFAGRFLVVLLFSFAGRFLVVLLFSFAGRFLVVLLFSFFRWSIFSCLIVFFLSLVDFFLLSLVDFSPSLFCLLLPVSLLLLLVSVIQS